MFFDNKKKQTKKQKTKKKKQKKTEFILDEPYLTN